MPGTSSLKLLAQDAADLSIISAALQDAVAQVGDITFESRTRRLTILFNRFRWESGAGQRVRSAVQIGGVLEIQTRKIRREAREAVVELLAIGFEAGEPPEGALTLSFAGGGDMRVRIECIDAILADVSEPWPTPRTPTHEA